MRLCIIANPNSIHTRRWVRYFAGRGHEVHLIGEKRPFSNLPEGITFHDLTQQTNLRKVRYLAWAYAVRRLVRKIRPDVLHAHQVASAGWLGAAAGYHPFIVTSWGSDLLVGAQRSPVQRAFARWVLSRADYVTCVSKGLAQAAMELGADPHLVEVVPWGVDRSVFFPPDGEENDRPPAEQRSRSSSDNTGELPLVLSIRAMRPLYNLSIIAKAIPGVLEQEPAARFVIRTYNADTRTLAEFQRQIDANSASAAIEYVGDLPDDQAVAEVYRKASIVLSVPSSDGTPQSVLEAMACGAVPVLSDLPWVHEWVCHEREALVVPVGDVSALSRAVVRLLREPPLLREMRAAALELVRVRGDSAVWMARNEAIYRDQVEATRRSSRGKG